MTITILPNWKFIRKMAIIFGILAAFAIGGWCGFDDAHKGNSSIGGTEVPANLHCEEDELIGFIGKNTLGCIHIDKLKEDDQALDYKAGTPIASPPGECWAEPNADMPEGVESIFYPAGMHHTDSSGGIQIPC